MKTEDLRKDFPILGTTVYGKPLVYLDNAATAQKPLSVLRVWEEMSMAKNANLHRAVHSLAMSATDAYEKSCLWVVVFVV